MTSSSPARPWRRLALVAAGFTVLSVVHVPTASATNFTGISGQTGCFVNVADNRTHGFFNSSLTTATASAVAWSRTNNLDPTDINTVTASSATSTTDVVSFDADYEGAFCGGTWCCNSGAGWVGYASCQSLNSANECERHNVYFDTDYMGPETTSRERTLACHEFGHTIGLTHRSAGCMTSPVPDNPAYTDHDRTHVNGWSGYNS